MPKGMAFALIQVTMLVALTIAFLGLSSAGAEGDALVLAFVVIGGAAALATSETVAYYAEREKRERRQSHNPPPSG